MSEDATERLDRLESLVERQAERIDDQQETIDAQRERIGKLEDGRSPGDGDATLPSTTRRTALKAGGLLALLGVGAGTAAADPQGQVGTEDDPIETLRAAAIEGPLTDDQRLDSLVGNGLAVRNGRLVTAVERPELSITTLAIPDPTISESFTIEVTIKETAAVETDGLGVRLTITDSEENTAYEAKVDIGVLQDSLFSIVFGGADETPPVGPFDADDYTATVTATAANAARATATDSFVVNVGDRFAGGSGTSDDPYRIEHWKQLDAVRFVPDASFRLVADLNDTTDGYNAVASGSANGGDGFEPIRDSETRFDGSFDGDGHVIRELSIDRANESDVGLFGGNDGTVRNLGVEDAEITGGARTAGLVGKNGGTLNGCHGSGDITGTQYVGGLVGDNDGSIAAAHAAGTVSASHDSVGGLVGHNNGRTAKCFATADVSSSGFPVGGLVGLNNDRIEESYATGDSTADRSVGGIAGMNDGSMEHCYATGAVSDVTYSGGIAGLNPDTVIDSYWDTESTDQDTSAGSATGLTTGEMQGAEAADNMTGFDFSSVWETVDADDSDADADDYPVLQALDRTTQLEGR